MGDFLCEHQGWGENSLWFSGEFVLEMGVNLVWKLDEFVLEMGGISSTKFGEIGDGVFFDEEIFCKLDFMYRMAVYSN